MSLFDNRVTAVRIFGHVSAIFPSYKNVRIYSHRRRSRRILLNPISVSRIGITNEYDQFGRDAPATFSHWTVWLNRTIVSKEYIRMAEGGDRRGRRNMIREKLPFYRPESGGEHKRPCMRSACLPPSELYASISDFSEN